MNNCLLFFQNDIKNENRLVLHSINQKIKKLNINKEGELSFYKINKKKWNILSKFINNSKKVKFFENYIQPEKKFSDLLSNDIKNLNSGSMIGAINSISLSSGLSNKKNHSLFEKKNQKVHTTFDSSKIFVGKEVSPPNVEKGFINHSLFSFLTTSSIFFCKTSEKNLPKLATIFSNSPFIPICAIVSNCNTLLSKKFIEKLKFHPESKYNQNMPLVGNNSQSPNYFLFFMKKKMQSIVAPLYFHKIKFTENQL